MSEVMGMVVLFAPLFLVMFLANLAEQRRTQDEPYTGAALLGYLLVAALYGMGLLSGLLIQVSATLLEGQPQLMAELGLAGAGAQPPLAVDSLALLGLGLWLPSAVGLLLLLPPVRRLAARVIPMDAHNPVHAVALSFTMLVVINLMLTLGVGLGNLSDLMAQEEQAATSLAGLWLQQILLALLALVGVGWLTRRPWRDSLARLGLTGMTGRQVLIGVGLGLAMVPVVMGIEYAAGLVGFGPDPDVERLTEQLLGPLFRTPLGIVTLGAAAALGEETLFRGAVQPVFGLVVTALLFALLHSNYGITVSTLVVFLLGLVLGWVRIRHNTTTAMVVHAVYNMTLGLLAYLSLNMLDV